MGRDKATVRLGFLGKSSYSLPRAVIMGNSQFVAFIILGASILILFPTASHGSLPWWYKNANTDRDRYLAHLVWRKAVKKLGEFRKHNLSHEGLISATQTPRYSRKPFELKLKSGEANFQGTIVEAADGEYRGKKSFMIFTAKLQQGKPYQIDHISKVFQAFLYVEDSEGNLLKENSASNIGENSRLVFRPEKTGTYRLIATSLGGFRTGDFLLSIRNGSHLLKGVPAWFRELDTNGDGQVALYEWRKGDQKLGAFDTYDLNDDGLITVAEILRYLKKSLELKLEDGPANYHGTLEENVDEKYRGKKSFMIFTVKLQQGKPYQIDHISKVFQAFLYLEDSEGNPLKENSASRTGENSRIIFRPEKTGIYRLIATSLGGFRTGDFLLSVRSGSVLPPGLPGWFTDLDKNGDGQLALYEWREGNKDLREFSKYDLNDDGLITAAELLDYLKKAGVKKVK